MNKNPPLLRNRGNTPLQNPITDAWNLIFAKIISSKAKFLFDIISCVGVVHFLRSSASQVRIVIVLVNGNMERHEPQETGDDAQDDHDHSELSSELSFTLRIQDYPEISWGWDLNP